MIQQVWYKYIHVGSSLHVTSGISSQYNSFDIYDRAICELHNVNENMPSYMFDGVSKASLSSMIIIGISRKKS